MPRASWGRKAEDSGILGSHRGASWCTLNPLLASRTVLLSVADSPAQGRCAHVCFNYGERFLCFIFVRFYLAAIWL